MARRTRFGITLVELLTVIAIVMVLLAIVAVAIGPAFGRQRTQASCSSNLRQIAMAYQIYVADNEGWPVSGIMKAPWIAGRYGIHVEFSCPMSPGRGYHDDFGMGIRTLYPGPSSMKSRSFPNGTAIPNFDPNQDALVRCLQHGFDGFDKGPYSIWSITTETKGRVLGVRADGSVSKVTPLSCWEFALWEPLTIPLYDRLWRGCDRPSQ